MKVSHHLHKTTKKAPHTKKATGGPVPPAEGFKCGGKAKGKRKHHAIGGVAKMRHDQYD